MEYDEKPLTPVATLLAGRFTPKSNEVDGIKTKKYEVSEATSFLNSIYEKVRNTVDYKDEHLIRRFAIQRFLRVSLSSRSNAEDVSELLIKDLLRGGYITDSQLNDQTMERITEAIRKYIISKDVINNLRLSFDNGKLWDWILSVASSEVEKTFDVNYKPEVFIDLLAKYIKEGLKDTGIDLSPEQETLQVYIACHKALVRSDLSILRYHAMTVVLPNFFNNPSEEDIRKIIGGLNETRSFIDGIIKSKTQSIIFKHVRRLAAPFKVLEGVLETNPEEAEQILSNQMLLRDKSDMYIESFHKDLRKKLSSRITRTLGYLFITKMCLALIIEVPIDRSLLGHINWITLGFNTIVPIIIFYIIARRIRLPGKDNSERIHQIIHSVVFNDKVFVTDQDEKNFKKAVKQSTKDSGWVGYVYGVLYLLVYGLIALILHKFEFNFISIFLFLFFVSVLSYFAWNIRARCMDLQIVPRKLGVIESLLNVIVLPILKVGQVLSAEVARLNVFTLLFDFILEAPFKLIVQAAEDVIDYLKSKHEEVIQG